jgi:hypothetical protein
MKTGTWEKKCHELRFRKRMDNRGSDEGSRDGRACLTIGSRGTGAASISTVASANKDGGREATAATHVIA